MNEDIIKQSLKFYNVKPLRIYDEQKGYRNRVYHIRTHADDLNLIFYKNEPGILARVQRADALSEHVFRADLPVRHLFSDRTITLKNKTKTIYARLYYYLPGDTIAWEMYTMKHIKLLGWAMSDLHAATADANVKLPKASDELLDQLAYITEYFENANIQSAIHAKLKLFSDLSIFPKFKQTILAAGALPSQPLHLDLVRGNILFARQALASSPWHLGDLTISGIIDFEKAALGSPLFDLARTYAFLLADCANKTPEKILKYLIYSGYNKRGGSHIEFDHELFQELVNYYLFYDFYKFLEHNPYEFLAQNHHFIRTKDILIAREVLKSI